MVLHAYFRDAYAKYINGDQGAIKGIVRLPDGTRPEDLSLFHSPTCKNNVVRNYYRIWRTYTFSFSHG